MTFSNKQFTQAGETAVRLMLRHPWFMGLYYSMQLYEDRDMPMKTLATNGTSIWIDPDFWAQLNRDQRMTAIAHEMGHKMYLHPARRGDRNPMMFNIAGDHRINLDLKASGFAPLENMTINGKPWSWFCDDKYNHPKPWTTEAIYDDIEEQYNAKAEEQGKDAGDLAGEDLGAAADLVDFGSAPDGGEDETTDAKGGKETLENFEQRVRKELKEAEQMAKMAGNCPSWMKNTIDNADHVKVNWYDVLEQYMRALSVADYSWARFSKREFVKTGVMAPDMWQPAMGGVVLFVDCSGSCCSVLGQFNKHTKDVFEQVKPKWIEVRYFQNSVEHEYDQRFERGDYEVGLRQLGGGGTDFKWLADEINELEERPEVCIFLTDMYGAFGREPDDVPVFFISTSAVNEAPFGVTINV